VYFLSLKTMTEPVKFIFLELDGVLNTPVYLSNLAKRLSPEGLKRQPAQRLCPPLVRRLNYLVGKGKVVVTSRWWARYDVEQLNTHLKSHGFTGEVSALVNHKLEPAKATTIRRFLAEHPATSWVALDSEEVFKFMPDYAPRLVKVNPALGLCSENLCQAINLLDPSAKPVTKIKRPREPPPEHFKPVKARSHKKGTAPVSKAKGK